MLSVSQGCRFVDDHGRRPVHLQPLHCGTLCKTKSFREQETLNFHFSHYKISGWEFYDGPNDDYVLNYSHTLLQNDIETQVTF
jgi:hypothetical protein